MKNKKLVELRLRNNLSQLDVAMKCGWQSGQYVSNFERGVSLPPISSIEILAKLYNVGTEELKDYIFDSRMKLYEEKMRKKLWPNSKKQ